MVRVGIAVPPENTKGVAMKFLKSSLAVAMLGSCVAGCYSPEPAQTRFGMGAFRGWEFHDSKDNDVSVEYAGYNSETKQWEVKNLTIRNNASDVNKTLEAMMLANAEQWKAVAEHTRALGEATSSIAGALSWLAPAAVGAPLPSRPVAVPTTQPGE